MNEKDTETKDQKETVKEKKQTCVYCGPTVRGVVRQYEVYNNGTPETLEKFFENHPVARSLLVPVDLFAATRANLEKAGTAEMAIFNQIKKEL